MGIRRSFGAQLSSFNQRRLEGPNNSALQSKLIRAVQNLLGYAEISSTGDFHLFGHDYQTRESPVSYNPGGTILGNQGLRRGIRCGPDSEGADEHKKQHQEERPFWLHENIG